MADTVHGTEDRTRPREGQEMSRHSDGRVLVGSEAVDDGVRNFKAGLVRHRPRGETKLSPEDSRDDPGG